MTALSGSFRTGMAGPCIASHAIFGKLRQQLQGSSVGSFVFCSPFAGFRRRFGRTVQLSRAMLHRNSNCMLHRNSNCNLPQSKGNPGCIRGPYSPGIMYRIGFSAAQDFTTAARYNRIAEAQGHADATSAQRSSIFAVASGGDNAAHCI
jgi:hypothetical protein